MEFGKVSGQLLYTLLFIFQVASANPLVEGEECIVKNFKDISEAIENCTKIILDNIVVPGGTSLNLILRDGTTVYFRGTTTFEYYVWDGPLVAINGTNVTIAGEQGSILDGQGQLYWDGLGEWGTLKPKFFVIQLHDSVMKDIYVKNSPVHCVLLTDSTDVKLLGWTIDNLEGDPENVKEGKFGHNTDGFDVWNSYNVEIKNSEIFNQDDCVAIRSGADIWIDNLYCHGSHGLSISVGFVNDSIDLNTLKNVRVSNSILYGGENGIHIKTHVDADEGLIENVTYENILINGSTNYGLNIQQNYRNLPANSTMPSEASNNIPIRNLKFKGIYGSVADTAVPIYIMCAEDGCFDWEFSDVQVIGEQRNDCNFTPNNFSC